MDLKDIKAIIDLMKKNSISEFELEKQEFKIRLKRSQNGLPLSSGSQEAHLVNYPPQALISTQAPPLAENSAAIPVSTELEIKSPMVGTFYRAPSPESANYADVGTEVTSDSIVCIIEAMKVMNEIKAEIKGVITQVLVENAKPVEFNQALFKIRPT